MSRTWNRKVTLTSSMCKPENKTLINLTRVKIKISDSKKYKHTGRKYL